MKRVVDYDSERDMAFKRIFEAFGSARRRRKEMLKWYEDNPSPRMPTEQLNNLKAAVGAFNSER